MTHPSLIDIKEIWLHWSRPCLFITTTTYVNIIQIYLKGYYYQYKTTTPHRDENRKPDLECLIQILFTEVIIYIISVDPKSDVSSKYREKRNPQPFWWDKQIIGHTYNPLDHDGHTLSG